LGFIKRQILAFLQQLNGGHFLNDMISPENEFVVIMSIIHNSNILNFTIEDL